MIHRRPGPAVLVVPFAAVLAMALVGCGSAPLPSATPLATAAPPTLTPALSAEPTIPPTGQSTGLPTLQPTGLPTDPPATSPAPSADPVLGDLLPHVPAAIRASCQEGVPLEPVSTILSCSIGDGGIAVEYAKYPDRDSMYGAYNATVGIAQIEIDSGLCYDNEEGTISATPGRWPAEHDYSIAGSETGRYLCLELDLPSITWTDDRFNILAVAAVSTGEVDRLVAFWLNEAGPVE